MCVSWDKYNWRKRPTWTELQRRRYIHITDSYSDVKPLHFLTIIDSEGGGNEMSKGKG